MNPSGNYRKRKRDIDQVDPDYVRDPAIPSDVPLVIEVPNDPTSNNTIVHEEINDSKSSNFPILSIASPLEIENEPLAT